MTMPGEDLRTIGDQLQAEHETWLAGFSLFWLDHFLRAASDGETIGQAQADFTHSVQEIQTWLDLDSWLTSGFLPAPGVVSPPASASKTSLVEHPSGAWPAWPAASPVSPASFSPEEFSPSGSQPAAPGAASFSGVQESLISMADEENFRQPRPQKSAASLAPIGSLNDLARMVQITPYSDEAEAPEHPLESQVGPLFAEMMPGVEDATFEPPGLSPQMKAVSLASSEALDLAEVWQPDSFTDEEPVADDDVGSPSRAGLPGDWSGPPVAPSDEAAFLSPAVFAETDPPPASLQLVGRPAVVGSNLDLSGRPGVDLDTQENPVEASFLVGELARLGSELAAGSFSAPVRLTSAKSQPDALPTGAADWLTLLAAVTLPGRMPSLPSEKIAGQPVETLSPNQKAPSSSEKAPGWNDTPEVVRQIVETDADTAANNSTLSPLDVQDMLAALRQEIWREYRRFYGTVD
jgi:hypothetical protein